MADTIIKPDNNGDDTTQYDDGEMGTSPKPSSIEIPDTPDDYDMTQLEADTSEDTEPSSETEPEDTEPDRPEPSQSAPAPSVQDYDSASSRRPPGKLKIMWLLFWEYKARTIPATILVILLVLLSVPATRYPLVGALLRRQYDIQIVDSKTNRPVNDATVKLGDKSAQTDSEGKARLSVRVGQKTLSVDKKYYQGSSSLAFVGISTQKQPQRLAINATGRQVPITIIDKVSGKSVADAEVKILDTNGKTDNNGKAIIVLPAGQATRSAIVSANNYNTSTFTINVTDQTVAANSLKITPSGKTYFLSNASGSIDVVSTNLDGSDRKTVAQATGNEEANTRLFVSPSLKYLALFSKRDASKQPKLYVIDTSNNQVKQMDNNLAQYTPVGWVNDYFIYSDTRLDLQQWQVGHQELKSYSPSDGNATVLDKSAGEGTDMNSVVAESIDAVTLTNNTVLYAKDWYAGYSVDGGLNNRQNNIYKIPPNGKGRQTLRSIALNSGSLYSSTAASIAKPQRVYLRSNSQATTVYYIYQNNSVTQSNTITDNDFGKPYPKYYLSPSGEKNMWSEVRDGKSVFFVGDANADNSKQIASLEGYTSYGWYSNDYVLVSRDNQLYIIPSSGLDKKQAPLKISSYFTPST